MVKSSELLRKLSSHAEDKDLDLTTASGKGSHLKVTLSTRLTIVPEHNKELGKGLLNAILRDLGIDLKDLI